MYHLADVHWDVLNDIMSSYYLHNHQIFGLNALMAEHPLKQWKPVNRVLSPSGQTEQYLCLLFK